MSGYEPREPSEAERIVCNRCQGEQFRLYAGGAVYCAGCGARMANCRTLMRLNMPAPAPSEGPAPH